MQQMPWRSIVVAKYNNKSPASVRKAKESRLPVYGAKLFNLIPRHLRDMYAGLLISARVS